jgi:hypothetical protein
MLLVPGVVWAVETVAEIEKCVRGNAPDEASVQTVTVRAIDRVGQQTDSRAKIYWKRAKLGESRVLMEISDPPLRRGSIVLAIEAGDRADLFMYLPDLRKVKRVTKDSLHGSLFGTDLTYEDFERWQGLAKEADKKRLADGALDGRPVWVVEGRPARGDESEYERLVTFIDPETCIPLRTEAYGPAKQLRKVMTAERIQQTPAGYVPHFYRVEDTIDKTHTEVTVETIDVQADVPDRVVSLSELQRRGH